VDECYLAGQKLKREVFALGAGDEPAFLALERKVTAFQRVHCAFFDRYCRSAKLTRPYLPVEAFGLNAVSTFPVSEAEAVFISSGTGDGRRSRHYVRDLELYAESVRRSFTMFLGNDRRTILAHLPGYAGGRDTSSETEVSSLVQMARVLVEDVGRAGSGFFLDDPDILLRATSGSNDRPPLVLLGVAFGLLDLLEQGLKIKLGPRDIVMETGGMKTHRRHVARKELHRLLSDGFGVEPRQVWSEYGMCELMSQFYMQGRSGFACAPWVRFWIVNPENPAEPVKSGEPGRLAVVDLANVYTVSTLLTSDLAVATNGGFEVLGRLDAAQLRGCNFLVEQAIEAIQEDLTRKKH
jgi:hypothetical protein